MRIKILYRHSFNVEMHFRPAEDNRLGSCGITVCILVALEKSEVLTPSNSSLVSPLITINGILWQAELTFIPIAISLIRVK